MNDPNPDRYRCAILVNQTPKPALLLALAIVLVAIAKSSLAAPEDHFVTTWKTDNPGDSNDTSITIPMVGGPYAADWDNDGIFDEIGLADSVTHDFGVAGTYAVRIEGSYESIRFEDGGDKEKILSVDQWGTQSWATMAHAFHGCRNLQVTATDTPDFSAVTDMSWMFAYADLVDPDTSGWDTSAVTDMSYMFWWAVAADPDTGGWNTSAVSDMTYVFASANSANPDVSSWDMSAVTSLNGMFAFNTTATPDTSNWDTSAVTDMSSVFAYAIVANPDTSGWNTSAALSMRAMFTTAFAANPDVSSWDTSSVTDMAWMFADTAVADPDTSAWDTSAVTNMSNMFRSASSADPDVSGWNVTSLTDATDMFLDSTLSEPKYDSLLINWSAQELQSGVNFSAGNSTYCSNEAAAARENMVLSASWVITDGGRACAPETEIIFEDNFEPFGLGTATVDGFKARAEWDRALKTDIFGNIPGLRDLSGSVLYVMNDSENIYVAVEILGEESLNANDAVEIYFDSSLDRLLAEDDDGFAIGKDWSGDSAYYPADGFWNDTEQQHGTGSVQRSSDVNFYEMSKPLNSGDPKDIALEPGGETAICVVHQFFGYTEAAMHFPVDCGNPANEQNLYHAVTIR